MKRTQASVDNRRNRILEVLQSHPEVRVDELSEQMGGSLITIRRDLQILEDQKRLKRVYGGAVAELAADEEVLMYRNLIARYAASLVSDNDNLFINTSRNALQMLEYIQCRNVTVITNNGKVILCDYPPDVNIVLTGGELRHPKGAMVGDVALRSVQAVYANMTFVGCSGINAENGMTTEIFHGMAINEMMIDHATKGVYVLADHTKIGKKSGFISSPIEKIKVLITDEKAPKEALDEIQSRGVIVHQVKKGDF